MTEMSHERCSELLAAFADDRLPADQAGAVEAHLRGCEECALELRALNALRDTASRPLTESERSHLHAAVARRIVTSSPKAASTPVVISLDERRRRRNQKLATALGAAAALTILAASLTWMGGLFGSGDGTDRGADAGAGDIEDSSELAIPPGAPAPRFAAGGRENEFALGANARTAEESADSSKAARRTAFIANDSQLRALGTSMFFREFSRAYPPEAAEELGEAYIADLAEEAGSRGAHVARCARSVYEGRTGPLLPVFGTFTRYRGEDSLVIGFVYTTGEGARLDRYTIWVWPRGSCETPVTTTSGTVPR
jgi:anti-sigma factor RsiW